jgi:hypothetical protein
LNPTRVGSLGGGRLARVDAVGTVTPERVGWDLAWWVGADDRWHLPPREAAVRQSLLDDTPVVVTAMRVPGGDAVHRVYGIAPGAAIVEITNDSPAPFVFGLVVRGAAALDVDGATLVVDHRDALFGARPPARWAVTADGTTAAIVARGDAESGAFAPRRDRGARLEGAFLYPVAHRTTARFVVPLGTSTPQLPVSVPDAETVARGWRAQLDRGMQAALPEPGLQAASDRARAQLLLAGQEWSVTPPVVAALEDWGFDDEARAAWTRLGLLGRRRAARRDPPPSSWDEVRALAGGDEARFLGALRSMLVDDRGDEIMLVSSWPVAWRGLALDVRDAPNRRGRVSFSVRWHGDRAALIWEAPEEVLVRAPGLDPAWSARESRGEALLAAVR